MKYYEGNIQGECLAGPCQIGMATSVIYSCMGIAFVHHQTKCGGLYHDPAHGLGNSNVRETIIQIMNDVSPDFIVLTRAKEISHGMSSDPLGSSQDDIVAVTRFLRKTGGGAEVAHFFERRYGATLQ